MSVPPILLLTGPRAAAVAASALDLWGAEKLCVYDAGEIYPALPDDEAIGNLMVDTWNLDPRVLVVISAPEIGPEALPVLASGPAAAAVTRYHTDSDTAAGIMACHLVPRALGRE